MPARDDLGVRHRGYAEFGAIHRLASTKNMFEFFAEVTQVTDETIKSHHSLIPDGSDDLGLGPVLQIEGVPDAEEAPDAPEPPEESWYNSENYYRIYDLSSVWVGVLEANAKQKKAQAARRVLQANDVGIMLQETKDSSSRIYPDTPLRFLFDSVTLVGDKQANGNARGMQTRVALVPNLEHYHDTFMKLYSEYDMITGFLRRYYGQSFLPDKYTPHAEFMIFRNEADHRDISKTISGLKDVLAQNPLDAPLNELEFPDPRPSRLRRSK